MKLAFYLAILAGMYLRLSTLSVRVRVDIKWGEVK